LHADMCAVSQRAVGACQQPGHRLIMIPQHLLASLEKIRMFSAAQRVTTVPV
jgi:hypothetical protein